MHATFQRALGLATGEFICILESDDYFLPTRVGRAVDHLLRSPEDGFVHGDVHVLYGDRVVPGLHRASSYVPPTGWVFEDLLRANPVVTCSACVRAEALRKYGRLTEYASRGYLMADHPLWLDLAAPRPLRIHPGPACLLPGPRRIRVSLQGRSPAGPVFSVGLPNSAGLPPRRFPGERRRGGLPLSGAHGSRILDERSASFIPRRWPRTAWRPACPPCASPPTSARASSSLMRSWPDSAEAQGPHAVRGGPQSRVGLRHPGLPRPAAAPPTPVDRPRMVTTAMTAWRVALVRRNHHPSLDRGRPPTREHDMPLPLPELRTGRAGSVPRPEV